jgi:hypothetical protein
MFSMARLARSMLSLTAAGFILTTGVIAQPAAASVVDFTSSAAFNTATAGETVSIENYATGTAGETIANPGSFNGPSYSFTAGPFGTLTGGIITNAFNSFTGLSLGGNQSDGLHFFFGGDSVTITFPKPVTAAAAFFNVNTNSGNYDLLTSVGDVSTDSAAYDTDTFVFDGITSTTPFSSITLVSTNTSIGSFNIPEIEFATATPMATPVPAALPLFMSGLGALGFFARRRKQRAMGESW